MLCKAADSPGGRIYTKGIGKCRVGVFFSPLEKPVDKYLLTHPDLCPWGCLLGGAEWSSLGDL
jgi:hypothetical protein